ncbi:MAG: 4-carboxymuconolactone decarboxylase [Hyphomicrobiaceae bacterium]|jgi:4-carboxymuconolactone decarboxylase
MTSDTYQRGKALADDLNPGMEDALRQRYGRLVPGLAESVVDFAFGQQLARDGLDLKTRYLATIAALTASGDQRTQRSLRSLRQTPKR